jgi:hypothetical protein
MSQPESNDSYINSCIEQSHSRDVSDGVRGDAFFVEVRAMCACCDRRSNSSFQACALHRDLWGHQAGLLRFSGAIDVELKGKGVRVMVACPGPTATQFVERSPTTMPWSEMDSVESVARKTLEAFDLGQIVSYPELRVSAFHGGLRAFCHARRSLRELLGLQSEWALRHRAQRYLALVAVLYDLFSETTDIRWF